jgi:hypothetical protein
VRHIELSRASSFSPAAWDVHREGGMNTKSPFELALTPAILTAIALGIGGALAGFFPLPVLALYFAVLPLPVMMLWLSRDVPTPEARIAAVDAERAALPKTVETKARPASAPARAA